MKTYNFWSVFGPRKMMQGDVEHTIKVTYLGKGVYGCRVYTNGELNAENRCIGKQHIGAACRDLLRFEDKLGNYSKYAHASRMRSGRKQAARNKTLG